jgi:hypothetical protein
MGSSMATSVVVQLLFFGFQLVALLMSGGVLQVEAQGTWEILVENAGIASMHTAITRFNTAVLLDRTDIGASQLALPNGECRNDGQDEVIITCDSSSLSSNCLL